MAACLTHTLGQQEPQWEVVAVVVVVLAAVVADGGGIRFVFGVV